MVDYLIVGNGVAGTTAAEAIRERDKQGTITMVSEEDLPFYYRIRLNEYISGEISEEKLIARKEDWYKEKGINLRLSLRIRGGNPEGKYVVAQNEEKLFYDRLLIATGSHSFLPPIKGSERKGVFTLRSMKDAREILAWARNVEEVVLIGGGLLGLETGNSLRKLGKKVTVVEFFPRLLPRQLDEPGAVRLQRIMEGMGFSFRLGAKTQEVTGAERAKGVKLESGETLTAGMVIISAGVRANLEMAEAMNLDYDRGIKVDEHMMTSKPEIYAAGDVAEFKGMSYGIWPAAMEQGRVAGANMGGGELQYEGTTMANTLKVAGIALASAGNIDAENKLESRVFIDENCYKKVVIENERIVGCIMLGDTRDFNKITKMMSEKQDVSKTKDQLISG